MRKIIVNADDYGLSPCISRGIISCFSKGAVTSTTVLATHADDSQLQNLRSCGIPCGIHLNLTAGKPLLGSEKVRTLVDGRGMFHSLPGLISRQRQGLISPDHVRRELCAQIDRLSFLKLTHFDGHRHFYFFSESLFIQVVSLMRDFGFKAARLPLERRIFAWSGLHGSCRAVLLSAFALKRRPLFKRYGIRVPVSFFGQQFAGQMRARHLRASVGAARGVTEIMVHPGAEADSGEYQDNRFDRPGEMAVLKKNAGYIKRSRPASFANAWS